MAILILRSNQLWYCPNCEVEAQTFDAKQPFHPCPKLPGLLSPLVRQGVKAKVEAVEREDYIGNALVQVDAHGRPIMSIVTTRDEGQDVAVYPETATAEMG